MKLILFLSVLVVLSSTAGAIQCERCINPNDPFCTEVEGVTCPELSMCFTAFVNSTQGPERIFRNCTIDELCPASGTHVLSVNLGPTYAYATVSCCDTDNCNNDTLAFPEVPELNSYTCPGCDPSTANCDQIVNCRGEETTCIAATVVNFGSSSSVSGCGSAYVCEAAIFMGFLPFLESLGSIFSEPNCPSLLTTTTTPYPPTTTTPYYTNTPETTTESPTESTTTAEYTHCNLTDAHYILHHMLNLTKADLYHLYRLSYALKAILIHHHAVRLALLHQQLLQYQKSLLSQQCELPFYHHQQLPLLYQQNMILNHQQLILHQIHQHVPVDRCVPELSQQQLLVLQLQQQLHQYQTLLMMYSNYHPEHIYYPHMLHDTPFTMPFDYSAYQ